MKKSSFFERIFGVLFGIVFIVPVLISVVVHMIMERIYLSRQLKRLKKAGYKIGKVKENGQKFYLFTYNLLSIKFLPNETFDISFDAGKTYVPITQSNLGTPQEIASLENLKQQYDSCDYRDRDLYDLTNACIDFILKNITLER